MGGLLLAYSSGPKGGKIDYRTLLESARTSARSSPADVLNPADYYFLGLFNFFVAKRRDAAVAKLFSLFQGVFPDLDLDTPFDTAERLLRTGVSREPENFWPHFVLGRTLLGRKDFKGAELAFNVCISIDPTYARGFEQRALALAEQWQQRRYDEVLRRANDDSGRALELAGDDPSTFWPRGEMLQTLGLFREALDAYSRWMQLEQDVLGKLSRSTGVQKAHDLAQSLLERRNGAAPGALHAECFALLGFTHLLWGQLAEADDFAARALMQDPNHVHARTVKGILLCGRGELAAGIAELEAATRADPTAYLAALRRAEAYEALGDGSRALQAWGDVTAASGQVPALPGWMRIAAVAAQQRLKGDPRPASVLSST
jgi:tetratricopeptide (TPR) repeat protein